MKICIIQGAFFPVPPLRGGAVEKQWHRLAIEFAKRGHQVTQISRQCDGLPKQEVLQGVQHIRVPSHDQPASWVLLKFWDLLYSIRAMLIAPKADIIVTHTFWAPVLLRRHRGVYICVGRMPKGQMRLYQKAARLRANTAAVRDAIVQEYPPAVSRTKVVPNPLPFDHLPPVQWERKSKVMLYTGRVHPEKGIELLLRAFTLACRLPEFEGWRLEIVGPIESGQGGGGEAWAKDLQRRFPNPNIVWCAPVYNEEALSRIYERARLFIYPSLAEKGETFGLAPLEAMAWGATPIVSNLACFRDFIAHDRNGIVFEHNGPEAAEALVAALRHGLATGADLAHQALAVRETHAIGRVAEVFLADFESILNGQALAGHAEAPTNGKRRRHSRSGQYRGASPWTLWQQVKMLLWQYAWPLLCAWTPKPFNFWRLFVLRCFGAKILGTPFVHQRTRIQIPWNVTLHDGACTGDRAALYSLDSIVIREGALVAQEAYICTGMHDLADPSWPLVTAGITIGSNVFVGARAFVLAGVTLGENSIIGACSVVTKDVPTGATVAGNPARILTTTKRPDPAE